MVTNECLSEIKKPPLEPYPRGSNNQLISPVTLNKQNKKKDITLTIQSLNGFPSISMVPLLQGTRSASWQMEVFIAREILKQSQPDPI
jgi:hypothetical protein